MTLVPPDRQIAGNCHGRLVDRTAIPGQFYLVIGAEDPYPGQYVAAMMAAAPSTQLMNGEFDSIPSQDQGRAA
jgi:hypothetical protein